MDFFHGVVQFMFLVAGETFVCCLKISLCNFIEKLQTFNPHCDFQSDIILYKSPEQGMGPICLFHQLQCLFLYNWTFFCLSKCFSLTISHDLDGVHLDPSFISLSHQTFNFEIHATALTSFCLAMLDITDWYFKHWNHCNSWYSVF